MANLGDDTTPVQGSEFSLPAGAKLDEDGGDLVVRDSAGEIILRRDETAGHWDFANTSLTNLAAVETEQASIGNIQVRENEVGDVANETAGDNNTTSLTIFDLADPTDVMAGTIVSDDENSTIELEITFGTGSTHAMNVGNRGPSGEDLIGTIPPINGVTKLVANDPLGNDREYIYGEVTRK